MGPPKKHGRPLGGGVGHTRSGSAFDKKAFIKQNNAAAKRLAIFQQAEEAKKEKKLESLATDSGPDDGTTSLHLERIFNILQDHHLNNPSAPFISTDDLVKRAMIVPKLIYPKLKRSLEDAKSHYRFQTKNGVTSYAIKLRHYAENAEDLVATLKHCYVKHGYRGEFYKNNLQLCYKNVLKDLKMLHQQKRLVVVELKEKNRPVHDHVVFYANPQFGEIPITDEARKYWERARSDGANKRLALLRKYNKPPIKSFMPIVKIEENKKKEKKRGRSTVALSNSHLKNFPGNL